ncbi:sigma factor-like helix-turn-helix DNA-binding protein [Frankia sp. AgKG'84/4]|uniref:sigma factor-like helix-turn-helix DNA-binding protein n=1 Tax=Frankia sp. AgKG'84/4 TaxID=573490 RepID=UPI00200BE05A|nr:sigma factor-like helix-turn-helix DNA-binding protein [Frankia sp. AgKG'84/4]MCL9794177.1 ECF-type sigma factor [Frankia sp. AgKG'84/4]
MRTAEGFEPWYAAEFPRLVASLRIATGDAGLAEEAAAEACARAYAKWGRVRRMESPSGWVYVVALNEVRSALRRRRLERNHAGRLRAGHAPPPADPDDALWRAVRALPERMRLAVALRYVADLPEAEIATAMGVARGTVAATLHSARRQLARELAVLTIKETP